MAKLWISQTKGCWVDLFEVVHFRGRRIRLFGPADYLNLWIGPEEWGDEARSLLAGPSAYVLAFEELNLEPSAVWLAPNQRVADVSDLPTEEELDSLRLFDRPPFASEPAFDAYAKTHGQPPPTLKLPKPLPKK
jgi:hypothetical protein